MDRQVDVPAYAETADNSLSQKIPKEAGSMLNRTSRYQDDPIGQGTELN